MAKRPGVYLFEAGSHEDILANDGKLAVDDFLTARRVLNSFSSLSFASDCSFFPVHYEEDLVQEERRKNFVLKDWAVAALVSDDSGKLLKALLVNLSHHDEGFLVDLRYGVILVAFYRGFDIREFPDVPVQFGTDFLSSIGIAEEEYAVSSEYSLDEDDEEAPIIEVEKPRFVANSKKKIVNFGGGEILTEEASDDEDEDIQIDVDRPSFQAGKKNKIRNLGSSYSVMDEEDDEEVNIDVARPSFQASSNKKPRNLSAKPDWKKKEKVIEVKEHIEVERPAFEAGKKRKIGAIIDTKPVKVAPKAKPIEKEEEKPVKISPVRFSLSLKKRIGSSPISSSSSHASSKVKGPSSMTRRPKAMRSSSSTRPISFPPSKPSASPRTASSLQRSWKRTISISTCLRISISMSGTL